MSEESWIAAGLGLVGVWLPFAATSLRGIHHVRPLRDVLEESERREHVVAEDGPAEPVAAAPPALSVIVAARDEERDVEATVRRLLAQSYDGLEVAVVDDRSGDRTGEILDRIAAEPAARGRLTVVHNRELPPGRLGKCHACDLGARRSRGDWLLFLDGDVRLVDDDVLRRIVTFAERAHVDHLTVFPDLGSQGVVQEALTEAFGLLYLFNVGAWRSDLDAPRGGGAVGAFNLVRRSAYERIGGHALVMMDVADDWKIGRLLRESGARQRLYFGRGLVRCDWHRGAWNVVKGLEKNGFGGCDYSVVKLVGASLLVFALAFGPFLLFVASLAFGAWAGVRTGAATAFPLFLQVFFAFCHWGATRERTAPRLRATLLFPVGLALLLIALWRSAWITLRQGGVRWRDTFYPLPQLRAGLVRAGAGARFRDLDRR
ncbi:MAG TPA: glycosyltransferase family 2 protein [Planctomycetota bacterium]|nr:glycosyltransferase family 2 protein [Planctomycetota bacterium]